MTDDQWADLVRRLEPKARANPAAYRRKVALLGVLGYAFLGAWVVGLAVLGGLVAWGAVAGSVVLLKFLIPIGALAVVILRALAVRLDPPTGVPIEREDAPALFRMIDDVNGRIRGPKLHRVLVDGDLNAGVVQIPRRGGIFGQTNYLVLGLPYMHALSPEELRAVVAHELGHLSENHGRFGTWVYRVHATWWQLLGALEEKRHWGSGLFRRFFHWYAPYFEAYSYPVRRAHEFAADQAAAEAAGPRPAATSLVVGSVAGRYLGSDYWPSVYRRADQEREPPRPFAPMRERLQRVMSHQSATIWLEQELMRSPAPHDTHPTPIERIRQLGLDPDEVVHAATSNGAPRATAAQAYLEETDGPLTEQVDGAWQQMIGTAWLERYDDAQRMKAELAQLVERAEHGALTLEEARHRAQLTDELEGPDEALPHYRHLVEREPDDAPANFAVGRILLGSGSDEGLVHLDRAMDADPEAVAPACELAFVYLTERGRNDEAERYRARATTRYEELELAHDERTDVSARGPFEPHTLQPEEVERLRTSLASFRKLKSAYLVRKPMRHLDDESPLFVLFVFPRSGLMGDLQKFVDEISARIQFDGWILSPSGFSLKRWQIGRIAGAKIYER